MKTKSVKPRRFHLHFIRAGIVTIVTISTMVGLLGCSPQKKSTAAPERTPAMEQTTVTQAATGVQETAPSEPAPPNYFHSNVVSVVLGEETSEDGLFHNPKERDGRTTVENLNGLPCRHLNLAEENKRNGYVYFSVDPDFKSRPLKAAKIEVEHFVRQPTFLRLQYDGTQDGRPKPYKSVSAEEGQQVQWGDITTFRRQESNGWRIATFRFTEPAFLNSQNGGADFRLEVIPAEIYVRRVTLTREGEADRQQTKP